MNDTPFKMKTPPAPDRGHEQSAKRRADCLRERQGHGVERDRRRQLFPIDQLDGDGRECWKPEAGADTKNDRGSEQNRRRRHIRNGQHAQRRRGGELPSLCKQKQPPAVDDVGECAGRERQGESGQRAGRRHEANQRSGAGQRSHLPLSRDEVHPGADVRYERRDPDAAEHGRAQR
jgi:hypothetical protein